MNRILFITTNDGSDMRISKEVKSLSKKYEIIYVGIGEDENNAFVKPNCSEFILIKGSRNKIANWLKLVLLIYRIIFFNKKKIHSLHIINEPMLALIYPLCFFKRTVLDLFDSFFLKIKQKGFLISLTRKLLYLPVNRIIVTDENRKGLMPDNFQKRLIVVENYPNYYYPVTPSNPQTEKLTIFYNGWMGLNRGTKLIDSLIKQFDLEIWMAGWFADVQTKNLTENPKVKYLGVMDQNQAMQIAEKADYIMCMYAPTNENNINASPNKIYDAIQVKTPVIINGEVKVSTFVKENGLGVITNSFEVEHLSEFYQTLIHQKDKFTIDTKLKELYSWEKIEHKLIACHE